MTEPLVDGDQLCSLETASPPQTVSAAAIPPPSLSLLIPWPPLPPLLLAGGEETETKRVRRETPSPGDETIVSKDQQEISAVAALLSNLDTKLSEQGAGERCVVGGERVSLASSN
jgi:hypothetical protein